MNKQFTQKLKYINDPPKFFNFNHKYKMQIKIGSKYYISAY